MDNPTKILWKAANRIMQYLSATKNIPIDHDRPNNEPIQGFSDANWGSELPVRKSVTGANFTYAGGVISRRCNQQSMVAQSSKESEFISLPFSVWDV